MGNRAFVSTVELSTLDCEQPRRPINSNIYPTAMTSLLFQLQALEVELHHPGVRCDRDWLEALLHPEFHEVGRSGCTYSRETELLPRRHGAKVCASHNAHGNTYADYSN